jgi:hypothetical protein
MTNNNVLNLVSQTLKTNNKLNQIKNKKAIYQKELQDLQTKYLVEFNKTQNNEELKIVQDQMNQEMIALNKKHFEEDKKKQEA